MPKFNTLAEWIPLLAKTIKCKKFKIYTYGNYWNDGSFENFIKTFDEEDEKLKKSNVYNVEVRPYINLVIIDVDYIRFYKDSKDDIIAHLWEKLYDNDSNSKRMKKLFEDCKAGKATEDDFK